MLPMTVRENLSFAALDRLSKAGVIDRATEQRLIDDMVELLAIKTAGLDIPVGALSGGNQQKVVIAKWLMRQPRIVLLNDPTRGIDVGALSHPLGVIPDTADISGSGKALAYAIARQESEFNVGAISSAGARGLLQLMPGTARQLAKKAGLTFSQTRLTSDAGYNATLGAAFLGEQLDRFSGSYVLTFAGYNAGPNRAAQWVAKYGDPRGKDTDAVVDWIERIPYTETRSYVQRVMENYEVYKMRISGKYDIVGDLVNGRS
ncbi:MAG: ATP-binding cassette domain-containing protein [Mesorhizobium sp.]|nr:MAG: ATP-binding cassette domain-containing protein [Mesorhizobium sp.]